MKFLRVYDHALTEEELAWNRVVDEARYFSRVAPLPVTNAVVATSVAGANGTEPAGCYAVDGRHTFIAPATVTVGGIDYVCTGYTVETRDGDGWSEPVFHKAAIFQPCAFVVTEGDCVRLTWQWAKAAGLANLGYDVGDYVWDDLVLFYDGICNVGTNQPHSYVATTWKNLGSAGATNDMFLQLLNAGGTAWTKPSNFSVVGERDPGAWTESGFAFKGDSRFRVVVQLLVDDRHAAWLGARAAAAAHEHVDFRGIYPFLCQHFQDHLVPKRHLTVDMGKLQQDRRVMELASLEQFFFIFKETDLGRG